MSEEQSKFNGWAVVEIMGHNREIGFVTTEYFDGRENGLCRAVFNLQTDSMH